MGLRAENWRNGPEIIAAPIDVAGVTFLADPSGALFHEGERALLVADLHLEKGSSFARQGMLLPPYDSGTTLAMLGDVVSRYAPKLVVALGDSFHDPFAASRLSSADRERLLAMQRARDWIWLTGNHDPAPHGHLGGAVHDDWQFGRLSLRHEPRPDAEPGEIAGHLHPVARVLGTGGIARRRCFLSDGLRCIMPAFGTYAGGLNIHHAAFGPLFGVGTRTAYALGRHRVYAVSVHRCVADA